MTKTNKEKHVITRIRSRLTYANVIATIALFAALGGAAWALGTGSVKSRHIAPKAVKQSEIAPRAVKSSEIAPNAVKASDLASGVAGAGVVMGRIDEIPNNSTVYAAPTGTSTAVPNPGSVEQLGPLNGGVLRDFVAYEGSGVVPSGASRRVTLIGSGVGDIGGCTIQSNTNSCALENGPALPNADRLALRVQTTGSPGSSTVFLSYSVLTP